MENNFLKAVRELQYRLIDISDEIVELMADPENEVHLVEQQEEIEYLQETLEDLQDYLKLCLREELKK